MTRRTAWTAFADEWDPENEAVRRVRDVLAPSLPVTEPPRRPEPVEVVPESTDQPEAAPEESPRRESISALIQRVRNGDLSAVDMLRDLLDRR